MAKYVVGAMAFILVVVGGYYLLKGNFNTEPKPSDTENNQPIVPSTSTYATSTYSLTYPPEFTLDSNFSNTTVNPAKPISGVKLTIPMTMATGTNLSADSFISIEQLPRANNCTADIYLAANVRSETITDGGKQYSIASSSDAGAGNRYEEVVYARPASSPCTAVRYFIHTTAIQNYPEGTVREYDRAALIGAFDAIRRSLTLTSDAPAAAPIETTVTP